MVLKLELVALAMVAIGAVGVLVQDVLCKQIQIVKIAAIAAPKLELELAVRLTLVITAVGAAGAAATILVAGVAVLSVAIIQLIAGSSVIRQDLTILVPVEIAEIKTELAIQAAIGPVGVLAKTKESVLRVQLKAVLYPAAVQARRPVAVLVRGAFVCLLAVITTALAMRAKTAQIVRQIVFARAGKYALPALVSLAVVVTTALAMRVKTAQIVRQIVLARAGKYALPALVSPAVVVTTALAIRVKTAQIVRQIVLAQAGKYALPALVSLAVPFVPMQSVKWEKTV